MDGTLELVFHRKNKIFKIDTNLLLPLWPCVNWVQNRRFCYVLCVCEIKILRIVQSAKYCFVNQQNDAYLMYIKCKVVRNVFRFQFNISFWYVAEYKNKNFISTLWFLILYNYLAWFKFWVIHHLVKI